MKGPMEFKYKIDTAILNTRRLYSSASPPAATALAASPLVAAGASAALTSPLAGASSTPLAASSSASASSSSSSALSSPSGSSSASSSSSAASSASAASSVAAVSVFRFFDGGGSIGCVRLSRDEISVGDKQERDGKRERYVGEVKREERERVGGWPGRKVGKVGRLAQGKLWGEDGARSKVGGCESTGGSSGSLGAQWAGARKRREEGECEAVWCGVVRCGAQESED
ncbi:hypothetical protein BDP67DRAFT_162790 [Colletotrichum lupini]|nr:hypothetical protein BDP67DRAFT_162790 [Colletotrichum lupini]